MCVRETSSGFVECSGLSGTPHCGGERFSWKVFGQYLHFCLLSGHRKGSQMLQLRTLFCSSMTGKNVTSVCVIQASPDQKNPSSILLNHCQGSAQAGLRTFSLLWRQVSFGAGVGTSFIWSRCTSVSSCWCSWGQNARQQAEGLDAGPECPLMCGGKGTKSTPRVMCAVSFPRLGGV